MNSPCDLIEMEENERSSLNSESELTETSFPVMEFERIHASDSENEITESGNPFESAVFSVDPSHQEKYLYTMNKRLRVHGQKFSLNDRVLLKRDFDNNPTTRKRIFHGFWHSDVFVVKERISDTSVRIESEDKTKNLVVSTTRLKKK